MQLKHPGSAINPDTRTPPTIPPQFKSIRSQLALATCSVIAGMSSHGNVQAQENDGSLEIDSALLIYSEPDRVTAIEPVVRLRKLIGEEEYVGLRIVLDSLTGSSPSGATPTNAPQTFTTPSGDATYQTLANEIPLDPSFLDTRLALNLEWEKPLSDTWRGVFSANGSKEYDYTSLGVATTLSKDFNQRNTTLSFGASLSADTVDPVGGAPVGLTAASTIAPSSKPTLGGDQSKDVVDLLFGVTQVISRNTLMQFNLTYGQDDGYLTDPYKILSVVDAVTGDTLSYVYENRPAERTRQSLYWKMQHQFTEDVLTASYRYFWDDWGTKSHTLDLRYRWELSANNYLQPHLRYYRQGETDFYRHSLVNGTTPKFASADYRLGEFTATTIGLKYGMPMSKGREFSARLEYMHQAGEDKPSDAIGSQRAQNLFGGTDAVIFQIGYSFNMF